MADFHHAKGCPSISGSGSCTCNSEAMRYVLLGVLSLFVCLTEFFSGLFFDSRALIADSAHTGIDMIENITLAYVSYKARFTQDEREIRRFGESVSALLLLILIAYFVFDLLPDPYKVHEISPIAILVGIGALIVNVIQYYIHNNAPEEHRNTSHWWQNTHLITDIVGSVVAIIGTTLASIGYLYADYGASIIIVIFVALRLVGRLSGKFDDSHEHHHHHH